MTLLVTDGRNFSDWVLLRDTLDALHEQHRFTLLLHGGANGADHLAGVWAYRRGILTRPFPADWKTHGRAAGPIRNRQMLDDGKPDLVVAFLGGKGTADMVRRAKVAGAKVVEV